MKADCEINRFSKQKDSTKGKENIEIGAQTEEKRIRTLVIEGWDESNRVVAKRGTKSRCRLTEIVNYANSRR